MKADWLFDDMKLLTILFRCGNSIVIMFIISPSLLDIYTEELVDEICYKVIQGAGESE